MGVSRDCPIFWGYPLLSQKQVKLRTSNFVGTFIGSIGTKAHENAGNSGRGRSQGVPKIFRAPICRAHCAVILAIAQLACYVCMYTLSVFSFLPYLTSLLFIKLTMQHIIIIIMEKTEAGLRGPCIGEIYVKSQITNTCYKILQ